MKIKLFKTTLFVFIASVVSMNVYAQLSGNNNQYVISEPRLSGPISQSQGNLLQAQSFSAQSVPLSLASAQPVSYEVRIIQETKIISPAGDRLKAFGRKIWFFQEKQSDTRNLYPILL